jgi:hypothetical protein
MGAQSLIINEGKRGSGWEGPACTMPMEENGGTKRK